MKIQEILKQPESKSLEFKKEIQKNRQNLLKTGLKIEMIQT
jgi:hypothetical protein